MDSNHPAAEQAAIAAGTAASKYGGGVVAGGSFYLWLIDNQELIYLSVAVLGLIATWVGVWVQARATKRREARDVELHQMRLRELSRDIE